MANRSSQVTYWTPVAVADATNFTSAGFHAILGGSSTQRLAVHEVGVYGMAGASSPMPLILAHDSTVGATLSGGTDAALDPATAALAAPPTTFGTATTKPQRSATLYLSAVGINGFGGILRKNFPPQQEPGLLGNTASLGEISISMSNAGGTAGLVNSEIIYEPL